MLAKAQQDRVAELQSKLEITNNTHMKNFYEGCISELEFQTKLLKIYMKSMEVANAQ